MEIKAIIDPKRSEQSQQHQKIALEMDVEMRYKEKRNLKLKT